MDVFDNFDHVQRRRVKRNTFGKDKGTCIEATSADYCVTQEFKNQKMVNYYQFLGIYISEKQKARKNF